MLAHNPGQLRFRRRRPVSQGAGVLGVIERRADVVAHPAVDGYVGAGKSAIEPDVLDRADLVDGHPARTNDGSPRFNAEPRQS
jgi:hypothetical protein